MLAGLLVLGCAPQRRPYVAAAPLGQVELPPDPAPLSDFEPERYRAFTDVAPAPLEPVFAGEAPAACRWVTSAWSGPVRITAQTEAFAVAYGGRAAQVAIPEGDASQGARVNFELLGLRLSVLVAAKELDVCLKHPQLFDGYLWARTGAPLSPTRASRGRIAYELRLPPRVVPVRGTPRGEEPCEGLSLDIEGSDQSLWRTVLGGRKSVLQARWRGAEGVPLARAPGQPPLALLDTRAECLIAGQSECDEPEPDQVVVLERRARSVRIAYALEAVVVVGWVPETALQASLEPIDADAFELSGVPGEPVEPFGTNDPTRLAQGEDKPLCAWNAPLAVEISGAVRIVGTIASAIPLLPRVAGRGWREVVLQHPALSLAQGARLWVPERTLYPCEIRAYRDAAERAPTFADASSPIVARPSLAHDR